MSAFRILGSRMGAQAGSAASRALRSAPVALALGTAVAVSVPAYMGSPIESPAACLSFSDFFGGAKAPAKTGPMAGQTVLVTGCSRGLGLEFVKQLVEQGATVIATCRSPDRAPKLAALGARVEALDTTSDASIDALLGKLKSEGMTLDVLINNAGISSRKHPVDPILEADEEDVLNVFSTNVLGNIRMTNKCLPLMAKSSKKVVVNLSSDLGSIHGTFTAQSVKVKPGGVCAYRISKAAGNMASRVFAAELKSEGAIVIAMSPGWVETDMGSSGGRSPPLKPNQSIEGMLSVINGLKPDDTGKFYKYDGSELPW